MRKNLISIIFVALFTLLIPTVVFTAPAMPRYGINEQTKECSQFFMGDECMSCTAPTGWEIIEGFQCPDGYQSVGKSSVCTPNKADYCCTAGHSGGNGDCGDVLVNDVERKCAFVEDISKCEKLPANWNQAEKIGSWGKVCPSWEYEWLRETLDCESKIIGNENLDNQNNIIEDERQNSKIFPIVVFVTVIIILLITIWFFLIKRGQK